MAKPRKRATAKNFRNQTHSEDFKFEAFTQTQAEAHHDFNEGKNLVLVGSAGTGKTYMAAAIGLEMLQAGEVDHIYFFRSAVQTRDIGALPGNEQDKMAGFETAIRDQFNEAMKRGDGYDLLKQKHLVSFQSTSFQRGRNYRNALLVVDEIQNCDWNEINTIVTRVASGARIILCGDTKQTDLKRDSGYAMLVRVLRHMGSDIAVHEFTSADIVRSAFVKKWIMACEKEFGTQIDFDP